VRPGLELLAPLRGRHRLPRGGGRRAAIRVTLFAALALLLSPEGFGATAKTGVEVGKLSDP
jgi:hypothetical protein